MAIPPGASPLGVVHVGILRSPASGRKVILPSSRILNYMANGRWGGPACELALCGRQKPKPVRGVRHLSGQWGSARLGVYNFLRFSCFFTPRTLKMRQCIVGECLIVLFALLLGCWWPLAPAAAAEERGLVLDDPDVQPPYFVCLGGSWLAPTQTVCCYNYSATFDSTTIAITVNWPSDFTLTYDCGCSGEVPATSSTWQYACCRGPYYRQPCKICVTNNNLFITHYFGIIAETPCVDNAAE